eukprot:g15101.t1
MLRFWEGLQQVKLSQKLPHLEEDVLCVGFPIGGDTISVTSGVISRIEVTTYTQASAELKDLLKHGKYTGFPTLGVETQTMENSQLREAFGMSHKQKGVLINRVTPTSAAAEVLKANDILLAFDGEPIGNDGTVRFRKHERVMCSWLVAQKFFGETATLTVLREGKELELKIESLYPEVPLVPVHLFNKPVPGPSYFIVAGLVFTVLSEPLLESTRLQSRWSSLPYSPVPTLEINSWWCSLRCWLTS